MMKPNFMREYRMSRWEFWVMRAVRKSNLMTNHLDEFNLMNFYLMR